MSSDFLRTLVSLSVQGAVAGLLVLTLRQALGRRLSVNLRYVLWAVVLVKLLVPFNISSNLSVFNMFNHFSAAARVVNSTTGVTLERPEAEANNGAYRLEAHPNASAASVAESPPVKNTAAVDHGDTASPAGLSIGPAAIVLAVMAFMAAALLLRAFWKYLNLKIQIYKWRREGIGAYRRELLHTCLEEAGLDARYAVDAVFTQAAKSPFTFGFFNPIIVLPATLSEGNDETFRAVLYHEGTHIRLGHHRIKFFTMLLQCIFWFNPFVYLFNLALGSDMEMECDDHVLTLMDADRQPLITQTDYVKALVYVASIRPVRYAPAAAFTENGLKQRVKRILEGSPVNKFMIVLTAMVVTAACVTLLTGAKPVVIQAPAAPEVAVAPAIPAAAESVAAPASPAAQEFDITPVLSAVSKTDAMIASVSTAETGSSYASSAAPTTTVVSVDTAESVWAKIETEPVVMTNVVGLTVDAAATELRLEKIEDNTSRAVLTCDNHIDWYTLTTHLSADGKTLTYKLEINYKNTGRNTNRSSADSILTIYLPDKAYDRLTFNVSASSAVLTDLHAKQMELNGSAGDYTLQHSTINQLDLSVSAFSLSLKDNTCDSLTGSISAASLYARFDTQDFDLDLDASASSLDIRYDSPVTDADINITVSAGGLTLPDAWKKAPGSQLKNDLTNTGYKATLGESNHTLYVNASASSVSITEAD